VKCAIGAPEILWRLPIGHGRDVVREDGAARLMPGHDARHLRIFSLRFSVRCPWIETTRGMFHGKCFTPNKLDFRDLENCMNQFVDRA